MSDAAPARDMPRQQTTPTEHVAHRRTHPRHRPTADGRRGLLRPGDDIFFAAIEMTRMPIVLSDPRQPDNPLVFANQAFLAMTGYDADEIIGRNCRFLQGEDTDREVIAEMRTAIAERRDFATEVLNYRKDGYAFWNALFVSPVFDDAGELVYFFASQLDVTRRREAEDNLRQAQKMEAVGQLTGGLAHDFNNLLQVMVGYLELIDAGLSKPEIATDKLKRNIGNARAAADRAAALTQQLLSFSRKQRLEGRTLNLNATVAATKELGGRTLGEDVAIDLKLAPGLANCRLDAAQIETALLNIMINARDAMKSRPDKRLAIATREFVIERGEVSQAKNLPAGRYVGVDVSDTGEGIATVVVERVMDPFFTTKEEGQGTGLGLSMVYGFAKQSGGAAWITSQEGVGTTVSMVFPAVDEALPQHRADRGIALDRPGDETILLVEERHDVREMARAILVNLGYTVFVAKDGLAGLSILAERSGIDLLFTDILLPGGLNGVEVAREARRRDSRLKVLLTTGYAEASIERTDAGGREFDVLNKPYGRLELSRKVRVVLDGPTGVS